MDEPAVAPLAALGTNLILDSTFEDELRSTQAFKIRIEPNEVAPAPEMLSLVTEGAYGGQGRSMRVTIERDPAFAYANHNSGLSLGFSEVVPENTWLRVTFAARSLSGTSLLSIMKMWGGSTIGYVQLGDAWQLHQVDILTTPQATSSLIFSLASDANRTLQDVPNGSFLLDEVSVVILPNAPDDPASAALADKHRALGGRLGVLAVSRWSDPGHYLEEVRVRSQPLDCGGRQPGHRFFR